MCFKIGETIELGVHLITEGKYAGKKFVFRAERFDADDCKKYIVYGCEQRQTGFGTPIPKDKNYEIEVESETEEEIKAELITKFKKFILDIEYE